MRVKREPLFLLLSALCVLAFCAPQLGAVDLARERGKVLCGYQGWFRAEGDASGLGWMHYGPGKQMRPGHCTFDVWPDLSECSAAEKFPSPFRFEDGRVAELFSSVHPDTVRRHFRWMREYGIDGAFLQRFGTVLSAPHLRPSLDQVLALASGAADSEGRVLGVMYDLTNLEESKFPMILEDWKALVAKDIHRRPSFPCYDGRPLVAVFGTGFSDQRASAGAWRALLRGMRDTGCSLLLGVPAFWRTGTRDAQADPAFREIFSEADMVMPWTVGRMRDASSIQSVAREVWSADIAWCRERAKGYLPTIFPGFSWHNLSKTRGVEAPLDEIPRRGGRFLWEQVLEARRAGAELLYLAMFDEVDEGTAIFKCGGPRPAGESPFLDLSDVPSDHYLWLSGQAGRLLRNEITPSGDLPLRMAAP